MTQFFSWRKARSSEPTDGCVEVGRSAHRTIGIRDTKARGSGPTLEFTRAEWKALARRLGA
jgi:hypothetical protein